MPESVFTGLVWVLAVSSGLMAGVYATFSAVIMKSLTRLEPDHAIQAMNAINRTIVRTAFMPLFFGSTLVGALMALHGFWSWQGPGALHAVAGGVIYVAGMFVSTIVVNVPLNNALARINPGTGDPTQHWDDYRVRWTRWNSARAIASGLTLVICLDLLAR
ncbi:MAG: DUF1772 domain-containing protein [Pseudomonadota bacterium]